MYSTKNQYVLLSFCETLENIQVDTVIFIVTKMIKLRFDYDLMEKLWNIFNEIVMS